MSLRMMCFQTAWYLSLNIFRQFWNKIPSSKCPNHILNSKGTEPWKPTPALNEDISRCHTDCHLFPCSSLNVQLILSYLATEAGMHRPLSDWLTSCGITGNTEPWRHHGPAVCGCSPQREPSALGSYCICTLCPVHLSIYIYSHRCIHVYTHIYLTEYENSEDFQSCNNRMGWCLWVVFHFHLTSGRYFLC